MAEETSYWFSHDYNARNDSKIKKLIAKHGMLGYGIYWSIVEDLYNNANALHMDCDSIAYDLHTDCDTINSIINDFKLFVIVDENITSPSVEKRINKRKEKSINASLAAKKRWENANALQPHSDRNAIKGYKRKGKDIKGYKTIEPSPIISEIEAYKNECLKDEIYFIAPVCREFQNKGLTPKTISGFMNLFNEHLGTTTDTSKTKIDYRNHFKNWMRKKPDLPTVNNIGTVPTKRL